MRMRRGSKLTLGLLLVCLGMWIISRFCFAALTAPLTQSASVTVANGSGSILIMWSPRQGRWRVQLRWITPDVQPQQPLFARVYQTRSQAGGRYFTHIEIRWRLVVAVVGLLWLIAAGRRRIRLRKETSDSNLSHTSSQPKRG